MKSIFQLGTLLIALIIAPYSHSQPIGEQIMEGVEIFPSSTPCDPELAIITMNYPVRYLTHYPQKVSDEVRIRIKPLRVSRLDAEALQQRESTAPRRRHDSLLVEVIYEGDFQGDPYLTLIYNGNVKSRIIQGSDYRSIKVLIYSTEKLTEECQPKGFLR